jgi:hypothetical protein
MQWISLVMTLPTSPSAVRVRTWRALKASGCGALRDGVYLLPNRADCVRVFGELAGAVEAAQGEATLLEFDARDAEQQAQFVALFDRSADFKTFATDIARLRRPLRTAAENQARKEIRALAQRLENLRRIDFFPGTTGEEAAAAFEALRVESEQRWSPGEPSAEERAIVRLDRADFRGRIWATRARPWVDRLASAWLVLRFIDPEARFVWTGAKRKAPKEAVGFDFDGATFSHTDGKVTFEVIVTSFGLDDDAALRRLGEAVHYLDIGGVPSEEAAGLELVMRGLQARHADDAALLAAACAVFDALYSGLRVVGQ